MQTHALVVKPVSQKRERVEFLFVPAVQLIWGFSSVLTLNLSLTRVGMSSVCVVCKLENLGVDTQKM